MYGNCYYSWFDLKYYLMKKQELKVCSEKFQWENDAKITRPTATRLT